MKVYNTNKNGEKLKRLERDKTLQSGWQIWLISSQNKRMSLLYYNAHAKFDFKKNLKQVLKM